MNPRPVHAAPRGVTQPLTTSPPAWKSAEVGGGEVNLTATAYFASFRNSASSMQCVPSFAAFCALLEPDFGSAITR